MIEGSSSKKLNHVVVYFLSLSTYSQSHPSRKNAGEGRNVYAFSLRFPRGGREGTATRTLGYYLWKFFRPYMCLAQRTFKGAQCDILAIEV